MSDVVISVENLTKEYRIGAISHRTLQRDIQSWWAHLRGKEDPNLPLDGGRRKKLEALADENGIIRALKDVSFEVRQGEVLGIIGKNGAGKSTLLKILSRVTAPTTGCVKIKGRIGSLLEVGTGFHPELTGRENIYMNGAILGMKKKEIDRKLDEIIDFSGVETFIDTPVKRYSSGMYVRLAFAVAAHLEPEILVIDEVLAVGDAEFQKKCLGKMDDVSKKEGRTVLFVSHNLHAIEKLCNFVVVFEGGHLASNGAAGLSIEYYLNKVCLDNTNKNISERCTAIWGKDDAPRNKSLTLSKVSILDNSLKPFDYISTDDKVIIEIDFSIVKENSYAGFAVIIKTISGECVFGSLNNKEQKHYGKKMSIGSYRAYCEIPPFLFNNGLFTMGLNFYDNVYGDVVVLDEVLSFHVHDGPFVRGDFRGLYAGHIRPALEWRCEKIGD